MLRFTMQIQQNSLFFVVYYSMRAAYNMNHKGATC